MNHLSPEQIKRSMHAQNAVLVDIREKEEIDEGMVQNATWIPKSLIDGQSPTWSDFLRSHGKTRPLILYCRSGGRVSKVMETLVPQGFNVFNGGGFEALRAAGFPTQRGASPQA